MPGPFLSFLSVLSIFSLELSLECYTGQGFYQSAYLSATAPFAFALLVCLFTFTAKLANGKVQNLASRLLLLSYVVLPPTLLKLFQVKRAFSLIICCFLRTTCQHLSNTARVPCFCILFRYVTKPLPFLHLYPGAGLHRTCRKDVFARRYERELRW